MAQSKALTDRRRAIQSSDPPPSTASPTPSPLATRKDSAPRAQSTSHHATATQSIASSHRPRSCYRSLQTSATAYTRTLYPNWTSYFPTKTTEKKNMRYQKKRKIMSQQKTKKKLDQHSIASSSSPPSSTHLSPLHSWRYAHIANPCAIWRPREGIERRQRRETAGASLPPLHLHASQMPADCTHQSWTRA